MTFLAMQVVAEIDPAKRDEIEDAIHALLCGEPDHSTKPCKMQHQASTSTPDIDKAFAWLEMD